MRAMFLSHIVRQPDADRIGKRFLDCDEIIPQNLLMEEFYFSHVDFSSPDKQSIPAYGH